MNGTYIGTTTEVKGIEIRNKRAKKSPYPMKSRERVFMFVYLYYLTTTARSNLPPARSSSVIVILLVEDILKHLAL